MTQKITRELALEQLRALVAERGTDYVYIPPGEYGDCQYTEPTGFDDNGDPTGFEPSCAVGWVIDKIDRDALVKVGAYEVATESSFGVAEFFPVGSALGSGHGFLPTEAYDEDGVKTLQAFQSLQDSRVPYGKCLEYVEGMDLTYSLTTVTIMASQAAREYRLTDRFLGS